MTKKTCIVITGPTAAGKTRLAIELAQYYNTQIISADSRQCYTELNIGVAKPSLYQLKQVKHYFINSHSIKEEVNAAVFETYALNDIDEIFKTHDTAIMVGGTGLYIKAFCNGLDDIPAIPLSTREWVNEQYAQKGLPWLQMTIAQNDPTFYAEGEIQNPHRMIRALEVILATGKSIRSFQQQQKLTRPFSIIKIGIDLPRPELYNNINQRVDQMMAEGLQEEVQSLIPYRNLKALQTVGYNELLEGMDNGLPATWAAEQIKKNTRHYAKRQLTWFRKDKEINWFKYLELSQIIAYINNLVQ
jgi:tRNA dimethylallyltransferase